MRLMLTVILAGWFFTPGAVLAGHPNADPRCEGMTGAAFGLCNAATSMGCDEAQSAPRGCEKVAARYMKITGEVPPWLDPVCRDNAECAVTALCRRPDGNCGSAGVCEERPEACVEIYDPVCGCDGVTYSNACIAHQYGASIDYAGECVPDEPIACGGFAGLTCPGSLVCVDDPRDACDPTQGGADCGGICVEPVFCGGIAGIPCPAGQACVDDPRDACDPAQGGADCNGVCVDAFPG